MYSTSVKPIFKSLQWSLEISLQNNQNRAMRYFLYRSKSQFASNMGLRGDLSRWDCEADVNMETVRLWNRSVKMDSKRITKKYFLVRLPNGGHQQVSIYE